MSEYDPANFSKAPYFDDYDETKKFLRILFKPGRAVQARELTQLQSISQNQVSRFANHIFKEGSQVFDGQMADIKCKFLRIEKQYDNVDINLSDFNGATISLMSSSAADIGDPITSPLRAKVIHTEEATENDPYHIFFIEYQESIDGNESEYDNGDILTKIEYGSIGEDGVRLVKNTQYRCSVKVDATSADTNDKIQTSGDAVLISNDEGVFYVEGYFIITPKQIIPLYKEARTLSTILGNDNLANADNAIEIENQTPPGEIPTEWDQEAGLTNFISYVGNENLIGVRLFQFPTAKVGFDISRESIESEEDVTLLDNAFGSYNYAAPGGDRYKLELTLSQHPFPDVVNDATLENYSTSDFLEKLRVKGGVVVYSEKYPTYSEFEETLARRTYDESGNYTVRPFETEVREYFRDDRHILTRTTPTDGSNDDVIFLKDEIINGVNPDNTSFTCVVVHDDVFLSRDNERVDLTDGTNTYNTTVVYVLSGTPKEGATLTENENETKTATIITSDNLAVITKDINLPTEDDISYSSKFSPIQLESDNKNGLYSPSRLISSLDATEINDAIVDAKEKLGVGMSSGKAYIFGYEFENQSTEYLTLPKSRNIKTTNDQDVINNIGNFLLCDLVTGITGPYKNPTSQYYVELWGNGWNTGGDGDSLVADDTPEQLGNARVRCVNYNFNTDSIIDELLVQLYLYDVDMNFSKKLHDVTEIRIYGEDTPLFKINVNFGVEELHIGETLVGGETILYYPKNNTSIFCIPTNNSTKTVTELDSYETVKSITNCSWSLGNNGHYYLSSPTNSSVDYWIDLEQYPNVDNHTWSGSGDQTSSLPDGWDIDVDIHHIGVDTNIIETKYALLDNNNGLLYDLSDSNKFIVGNNPGESEDNKLGVWVKDDNILETSHTYTIVGASIIGSGDSESSGGINHIRTKTLKDIVSLREDSTHEPWFSSTEENEQLDGYYKVTLQNANIGDEYPEHTTGGEYWSQSWKDATLTVGTTGNYFDENTLPREYITDIGFSDVYEVSEILVWHTTDQGVESLKDVTEHFEFLNESSDNLYDHDKLIIGRDQLYNLWNGGYLRKGVDSYDINCTLYIRFKYFEHSGAGPIIVDSYLHENHHPSFMGYESIPIHNSPLFGYQTELRNCLDFRPLRTNNTPDKIALSYDTPDPTLIDFYCPIIDNFIPSGDGQSDHDSVTSLLKPSSTIDTTEHLPQLNYISYIARMSKIILRKNRKFDVLLGESSILPKPPDDDKDSMTLYSLTVPEYTYNADDVILTYIDRQRYTMEDISKLKKRIERVEYYTSLNLLEKEASELSITDSVIGGERFKNGILVDNFKGHGIGDVLHRDYNCAMDFENGELRPRFKAYNLNIGDPGGYDTDKVTKSNDGLLTLRYDGDGKNADAVSIKDPPRWLVQPVASRAISVNPFNITNWLGSIKMSPSSDTWKDTKTKPTVKINLEGENDAWEAMAERASGTQWNDWETTWAGTKSSSQSSSTVEKRKALDKPHTRKAPDGRIRMRRADQTTTITKTTEITTRKQTRTGIKTTIIPERVTKNLGDRVVDVSIVPFIRNKVVTISASLMKPNTQVWPFFDDIEVSEYCTPYGGNLGDVITTDDSGKIENLTFSIPSGIFKTGEREFRLTDSSSNNVKTATTSAEATYFAQGLLQTKESTVVSTRVPTINRQSVTDSNVVRDVITRTDTTVTNENISWVDPLAQTFLVDGQQDPKGIWVHSVDLFLANKPESGIPIRVQIRPTVNGYPHSSVVLPFAEAFVEQEDVRVSKALSESSIPSPDNKDTITRFKFTSPVYLTPNEYALVVMSNSDEYECYISEMGEEKVGPTTEKITQQPHAGVFFKSQNASTWSADQNVDLMFAINICKFEEQTEGGQILEFHNDSIDDDDDVINIDTIRVVSENVQFEDAQISLHLIDIEPDITNYEIPFNENINLSKTKSNVGIGEDSGINIKIGMNSSETGMTPVIDLDRFNLVAINNIVASGTDYLAEESAPFAPITTDAQNRTRYITRRVELEDGMECDDFKVYLTGHRPIWLDGDGNTAKSDIKVWIKVQSSDDNTNFENLPWYKLSLNTSQENLYSEIDDEFFEYEYNIPEKYYDVESGEEVETGYDSSTEMFNNPIARYAFKITLHTNNSAYIPKVKNFRTIAVT